MCGLAGFTAPGDSARAVLEAMTGSLGHRGPDGAGLFVDGGLALGHRRLAVVDLAGGAQPRVDPHSGDALAFNGEIYGYRGLAEELRRSGVTLCDGSDTEVLFQLLRRDGVRRTLERVDGMFAFAYRDGGSGTVSLARDRFGEKPLFYAVVGETLVFGSEIKALRRHPLLRDDALQPDQVDRFLAFEYLPGALTGYGRIRKLPPGHLLTFAAGRARVERWWTPRLGGGERLPDLDKAADGLEERLVASVRDRLVADVPVGVFLSGGVDSSLIAALAGRMSDGLTAFTVRMPDAGHDETPHARAVAGHCRLRHEVVDLGEADLLRAFDAVTGRLDELMADSSLLPTWLVCEAARRSVTVALGGDGADELFAGYPNHLAQRLAPVMARLPQRLGRAVRALLGRLPPSSGYMSLAFRLAQLSQGFGQPAGRQSFLWMSPFPPEQRPGLWRQPPLQDDGAVFAEIDALAAAAPGPAVERLLQLMTETYLPEHILAKVDRASMYNSLEVRAPYLARGFAEAAMALPTAAKLRGRSGKVVLKRLAARHLPRTVVERPKHGFALPLAAMLRGPLRERVADTLLDPSNPVAGWFHRPRLEGILAEHNAGRADFRKQIWSLFVLFLVAARPA